MHSHYQPQTHLTRHARDFHADRQVALADHALARIATDCDVRDGRDAAVGTAQILDKAAETHVLASA